MAVAVVFTFEGATLDQYDRVMDKLGLDANAPTPPGALFHWVAATDTGIQVTDVWETREQFEAFAAGEIGPATAAVGVPNPPTMTFYEVHNYLAAK